MRKTKYITSGGLAFNENEDMEKLRHYSSKGWHVRNFKFMGYTLEKGPSANYIYSVDYRSLEVGEADKYFDFFTSAGWKHITSEGDIHLFQALPGTKPIHSNRETVVEKHGNLARPIKWSTILMSIITALVWVGLIKSTGSLQITFAVLAVISSMITLPMIWTLITIHTNKWKAEGRKGLATFIKTSLTLLPILVAIIILFAFETTKAIRIIAAMIIGAIAAPTAVWAIMLLVNKRSGKKT